MIRGPGEEVEEESGEASQVLRERYVLFFSAAQETGAGEGGGMGEKGQVKYFPLWQRKWGKVEWVSSVLRNGLNHSRRG